jgi:hypothetical protein
MAESILVSDRFRSPVTAEKRDNGGIVLWGPRSMIVLGRSELERLFDFAFDRPRLGTLQRYPVGGTESPVSDETAAAG